MTKFEAQSLHLLRYFKFFPISIKLFTGFMAEFNLKTVAPKVVCIHHSDSDCSLRKVQKRKSKNFDLIRIVKTLVRFANSHISILTY